jgi:heterogeneous nuclear ribonucleoprotein A1/A3
MADRGTVDHGLDVGQGGNAGLVNIAGYYFDGCTSRDPVIGSALGGPGGAGGGPDRIDGTGGAYVEAVGPNTSRMGTATGGAGGTCTNGGAGGGSYICDSYGAPGGYGGAGGYRGAGGYGGAGGYRGAGGYGGAGSFMAEYGDTHTQH